MTLSGYTSTLPRLVVKGHDFKASFTLKYNVIRLAQIKTYLITVFLDRGHDMIECTGVGQT